MSKTYENGFLIDFMTISVKDILPALLMKYFCDSTFNQDLDCINFTYHEKGSLTGYNRSYRFLDERFITINWNEEHPEFGVSLNITGQGCSYLLQDDFVKIVTKLTAEGYQYNISRLDLAFDDFERVIPVDDMLNSLRNFAQFGKGVNTYTTKNSVKFFSGYYNGIEYNNVIFGAKGSESGFRLYDKRAEQKIDDLDYWYRLELQLRQKKANAVMDMLVSGQNISDIYTSVLMSTARFVNPKYQRMTDCPTAPFYEKFVILLGNYSLICIFRE